MNNFQSGNEGHTAVNTNTVSSPSTYTGTANDQGLRPLKGAPISEEQKGYLATCEESYNITRQMMALHALYPNSIYAI